MELGIFCKMLFGNIRHCRFVSVQINYVLRSYSFSFCTFRPLKMRLLRCLETLEIDYPVTLCHIQEERKRQLRHSLHTLYLVLYIKITLISNILFYYVRWTFLKGRHDSRYSFGVTHTEETEGRTSWLAVSSTTRLRKPKTSHRTALFDNASCLVYKL